METYLPILIFFIFRLLHAQNTAPVLDGVVEEQEWKDAQNFTLNYEVDPGLNPIDQKAVNCSYKEGIHDAIFYA